MILLSRPSDDGGLGFGFRLGSERILLLRLIQELIHLLDGVSVSFLKVQALLQALQQFPNCSNPHSPSIWPDIVVEIEAAIQDMFSVTLKAYLLRRHLALTRYLFTLKGHCREGCHGIFVDCYLC